MPLQKPMNSRKSPVLLRKRIPSVSEVPGKVVGTEVQKRKVLPLPDWMQPPVYPLEVAMRPRPAQSPPEIAPAFVVPVSVVASVMPVVNDELRNVMEGEIVQNVDAWQTVCTGMALKGCSRIRYTSTACYTGHR